MSAAMTRQPARQFDTRPRFIWPVFGHRNYRRETVAVFFDWSAAVEFVNRSAEQHFVERNLYIAEPQYDRRKAVWFAPEQLVEVEHIAPGRVAA